MEELINPVLSDRSEEDERKLESHDLRDPDGNIILPFPEMWEAVVDSDLIPSCGRSHFSYWALLALSPGLQPFQ